jgi:hypothetical protein
MSKPDFTLRLKWADDVLERLHCDVGAGDVPWYRKRAREGIEAARAELAKMRDDIWWRDEDLPF